MAKKKKRKNRKPQAVNRSVPAGKTPQTVSAKKEETKKEPEKQEKKEHPLWNRYKNTILTNLVKYGFSIYLAYQASQRMQDDNYLVIMLLELGVIAFLSDAIVKKIRPVGQIINVILIAVFNALCFYVFRFGTYPTVMMAENVESFEKLYQIAGIGTSSAVLAAVFALIPIHPVRMKFVSSAGLLSVCLGAELIMTMTHGTAYSPFFSLADLQSSVKKSQEDMARYQPEKEISADASEYYKEFIENYCPKPEAIPEKPNVLLIFAEGLSQNVIDDRRNIMPNVRKYQKASLNFKNYYNHTFSTYRGLRGQLYSGYQLGNYDRNSLISLQDVMNGEGYHTSFINAEPNNMHFSMFLEEMGFDEVVSMPTGEKKQYMEDTELFDLIFETMEEQSEKEEPFFTAVYTFGTHVGLNPAENHFGDGKNHALNKFHNLDVCFGELMKKLENSPLAENTVVIFTTDHASYSDNEYLDAFISKPNPEMDRIPLFFWYKGVKPAVMNAEGRNSVCLAPTVMDFLDISAPNYFLGFTMFAPLVNTSNNFDTIFFDGHAFFTSSRSTVTEMKGSSRELAEKLIKRYIKAKTPPEEIQEEDE